MKPESALYFKGLNGVRAIAALIVVLSHIDQFSDVLQIKKPGFLGNGMGGYAVDMFFVLSGFLITYLLFLEKEKTEHISLKKFYLRRIFRIWPLYYFALFVAILLIYFDVIPMIKDLPISIGLYSFLLAN